MGKDDKKLLLTAFESRTWYGHVFDKCIPSVSGHVVLSIQRSFLVPQVRNDEIQIKASKHLGQ